jgi:N-formylglutamate deformylase
MSKETFRIIPATSSEVPILLSVPHSGTNFPGELASQFKPELMQSPDDTDWFVDQLYNFAAEMGITMISAVNSRWVIDLNRDRRKNHHSLMSRNDFHRSVHLP